MGKVTISEKHSRIIRWCHWFNVAFLLIMIWSGLLIYWADQAFIKIPESVVENLEISYHLAEGMGWHFLVMWPFTINGLIYAIYLLWKGRLHSSYKTVQKNAYRGILIVATGSVISGLAIYKPVQLGWLTSLLGGYGAARLIHFLMMIFMLVFIAIHLIQVFRSGWNNLRSMIAGYEIERDR